MTTRDPLRLANDRLGTGQTGLDDLERVPSDLAGLDEFLVREEDYGIPPSVAHGPASPDRADGTAGAAGRAKIDGVAQMDSDLTNDAEVAADTATELDAAPPTPRRRRFRALDLLGPLVVFAAFLGFWEWFRRDGMRRIFDKPNFVVPSPVTVVHQFFSSSIIRQRVIGGLGWTTFTSAVGLAIAIVLGITLAVLMSQARWVERSTFPYMVALQAVPVLAIVPIIGIIFGYGLSARVFVCVMISIFPIVTNTLFGLTSAEASQHDLFTLRHASRMTRLAKLQFPAAMPSIFTGFRISAGLSVIGAVVGEQLFQQGSKPGLGIVMDQFRQKGVWAGTYAALVVSSLLGIFMFIFFGWLSRLIVGHWYEPHRN